MAQKYTILKALIQTSNKGFTLIELLVGLVITFTITGLAFDAFINSSNTFRNDQRNIDNSQNLSAILEIVGNDIQQAGEQITEGTFPVVKIEPNTDADGMSGSSKITIRRALSAPLTLCEGNTTGTVTALKVTKHTDSNPNCKSGTVVKNEQILSGSTPGALSPVVERPSTLMAFRSYRCKLDNPTIDYSLYTSTNKTDFCLTAKPPSSSPDLEKVRAAMSDGSGKIWTFDYTDDTATVTDDTTTTPATRKADEASIMIANMGTPPVTYPVGTAIYLIEERIYTLDSAGNLNMQKDGGTPGTLIKGIWKFNISAKVYSDKNTKTIDPTYRSEFNPSTAGYDWKTLAGVKVDLQAKYDGTGRLGATEIEKPENAAVKKFEYDKLSARAEFFPRNVLSK
jgi:type II secretory pathway pseudopilin PulG